MPFQPGSLEDVEAWAQRDFPTYFAALSTFPIAEHIDTSKFDGQSIDGYIILQPVLISALDIGVTAAGTSVYARITRSSDVELFCDHKVKVPGGTEDLWCIKPIAELNGIELAAPFRYCTSGNLASIDRLETLIRYVYLKAGEDEAVSAKLGFFKAHFRGACCDVALSTGALTEADDMADDEMLPVGDSPPGLIEDTDIGGLRDNPAATSIFNQYVHAIDEGYHDFKTGMLRQLGAMQTMLDAAEGDRMKISKELETQKMKTKSAVEEAEKWKSQYEGLKGTLQGALGQCF
ncbi:hypothetical protein E8E11_009152 [Didymella keratinophila]|nr:hypothetical protein E8E11_009152 [Didymella keratinophila]